MPTDSPGAMRNTLNVSDFLACAAESTVIDVRSPKEFAQGHIPGARSVPLFSDDERARVGKCYKREGHDSAVMLGLELAGPKMRGIAEACRQVSIGSSPLVHCWRGGMRSASVAWLLQQVGMAPRLLEGGYKSFRRAAREEFKAERCIVVLSGMTGAGKTRMLANLESTGEQVLDLEAIAHHRGSSFGGIGLPEQPTCEQFENDVFMQLRLLDSRRTVWIEDESHSIGRVRVPGELWTMMRRSPAIFLDVDRETRASNLAEVYGLLDQSELAQAIRRLKAKLGAANVNTLVESLEAGRVHEVAYQLLEYYDRTYLHASKKRPRKHVYRMSGEISAERVVAFAEENSPSLSRA